VDYPSDAPVGELLEYIKFSPKEQIHSCFSTLSNIEGVE
jgi:hypothetical protein